MRTCEPFLLVSSKRGQNSWPASRHITWRLSRWLNYFLSSWGKWTMNDLRQPMYCGAWRSSSPVAKIYERELWSLPHTADCFSENSIASDPGFSQPCSTPQDRERFSFKKKFGIITGRLVEKNASCTLVFEVACSVSLSMLSAFRCVSKWRTFWTFSRQKNHTVLEASSASAFLTTANSFWRQN